MTIEMPEHEAEAYRAAGYDEDVDFDYIRRAAHEISAAFANGRTVECCYQPGDGTRYPLVFVPISGMVATGAREKDTYDRHAVVGVDREKSALVCLLDRACYPLQIAGRGGAFEGLSASYVAEKWRVNEASSISLALLFREVAASLRRRYSVGSVV